MENKTNEKKIKNENVKENINKSKKVNATNNKTVKKRRRGPSKISILLILAIVGIAIAIILGLNAADVIDLGGVNSRDIAAEFEALNGQLTQEGKEYPKVVFPEVNKIVNLTLTEALNIFETKGDAAVFIGNASELYSRSAIEIFANVAAKSEIKEVYYLDIENAKNETIYEQLKNNLGEYFIDSGTNDIKVPAVIFIADGAVVSSQIGTVFSQESPYDALDKYQVMGIEQIYTSGIKDVLDSLKNKESNKN